MNFRKLMEHNRIPHYPNATFSYLNTSYKVDELQLGDRLCSKFWNNRF